MTLTRRYRFSSSHRLHAVQLSDEENRRVYGKCNNPFGHGHDYVLEVSVGGPLDPRTGRVVDLDTLDRVVREQVLDRYEHRNLSVELAEFARTVPTTENVALEILARLRSAWEREPATGQTQLKKIRIQETPRNIFEVTS